MRARLAVAVVLCGCGIESAGLWEGDAGARDAGVGVDARVRDGGRVDARVRDGGRVDAGGDVDAGTREDAGPPRVDAGPYDVIDVECESGTPVGAMVRAMDGRAFGGEVAVVPAGAAPDWFPTGELPPDRIDLPVTLRGGDYDVWVHFYTQDAAHDALYAGFGAPDMRRFFHRTWGSYQWRRGNDDDLRALHFAGVAAGTYTLSIGLGESAVRCDRVIVTNDPTLTPPAGP